MSAETGRDDRTKALEAIVQRPVQASIASAFGLVAEAAPSLVDATYRLPLRERGGYLVFERPTNLLAQLRSVLVLVGGDRVDRRSVHQVLFAACHRKVTVVLAGHLSAVDVLASHGFSPLTCSREIRRDGTHLSSAVGWLPRSFCFVEPTVALRVRRGKRAAPTSRSPRRRGCTAPVYWACAERQ